MRDALILRGVAYDESGGEPQLMIGYFGDATCFVEAPFRGTLIAPNARIELASISPLGHAGVFFGRDIEVRPHTSVTYMPLALDDSDGGQFPPCWDGASAAPSE